MTAQRLPFWSPSWKSLRFPNPAGAAFSLKQVIGASLVAMLCVVPCGAEPLGWSRFHGPEGHGYVAEGVLPNSWTDADYRWRVDVGGNDVGSPILYDQSVYLLASDPSGQKISLQSRDLASGELRWTKTFSQQTHPTHQRNTLGSSTPVADAHHVYFAYAEIDHTWLVCVDHQGREVWKRDFGHWQSQHGFGTSPCLTQRDDGTPMVVIFLSQQALQLRAGQTAGKSRMVAVRADDGSDVWETKLRATRSCYGVPAEYHRDGKTQLVGANTGNGLFGIDVNTGEMLWSKAVFGKRCCSTPIVSGDIAIGTTGSGGGGNSLVAVRIPSNMKNAASAESGPGRSDGAHRLSDEKSSGGAIKELYRNQRSVPYVPTPALKDNHLFMVDDRGIVSCLDVETGTVVWKKRIGDNFSASPIIVGDKLLLVSLGGTATVIAASDQYKMLGKTDLGSGTGATPAYASGCLLIRVGSELRCLSAQKASP